MKQEAKTLLKKSMRIAGVTCLTVGAVVVLSGVMTAKSIGEGGKYLANTVRDILRNKDDVIAAKTAPEETAVEEAVIVE